MSASAGRVLLMGKGDYDATVTYTALDWVRYQGGAYVAKQTTTGNLPTNEEYWQLLVKTASELSGLDDVVLEGIVDGQTIIYDAATKKFKNGNTASTLASLTDVEIAGETDGQILVYDATTSKWKNQDQEPSNPIEVGDVAGAAISAKQNVVSLSWSDPSDLTLDGVTLAEWAGTILVRKEGSAPTDVNDGTQIFDNKTRNAYASTAFTNTVPEYDVTYYYRFFPYTKNGIFTKGTALSILCEAITIVTWADGTDKEIAEILDAHYRGDIDIHDYWKVGDERQVNLSAMAATGVGESHVAQTVTMVLMNSGGKTLSNPINGKSECAFVVGQKHFLTNGTSREGGYMNSSNVNAGGWDTCARRTWCNNVYRAALPETFRALFKLHKNKTSKGSTDHSGVTVSEDYFALPSEKEVFGSTSYANATAEADNTQFKYYETAANRIKKAGESGSASTWWERSPYSGSSDVFCCVNSRGNANSYAASYVLGLAPFGCI